MAKSVGPRLQQRTGRVQRDWVRRFVAAQLSVMSYRCDLRDRPAVEKETAQFIELSDSYSSKGQMQRCANVSYRILSLQYYFRRYFLQLSRFTLCWFEKGKKSNQEKDIEIEIDWQKIYVFIKVFVSLDRWFQCTILLLCVVAGQFLSENIKFYLT